MESTSPEWQPWIGIVSFLVAVLSVAIVATTGEWPTDFGVWAPLLFVLVGILLVWDSRRTPTD